MAREKKNGTVFRKKNGFNNLCLPYPIYFKG